MKRIIFLLALFLVASGFALPSANAETTNEPIPGHHRISNSPYVLLNDWTALYEPATGERIPLEETLDIMRHHDVNSFASIDGDHVVILRSCSGCSTTSYLIGFDGSVTAFWFDEDDKLLGADVENDRLLWYKDGKTVMTTLNRDVIWEKDLGTRYVSLSTDRKTVLAASSHLETVDHVSVETGATLFTRTLPRQLNPINKVLTFEKTTVYVTGYSNEAHYIYNETTGAVTLTTRNHSRTEYAMSNGALHWTGQKAYSVHDVTTGETETYQTDTVPRVYNGVLGFTDQTMPMADYKKLPTKLELVVDKRQNREGDTTIYTKRDYPVYLSATYLDGTTESISIERAKKNGRYELLTSPFNRSYATTVYYDFVYLGKVFSGSLNTTDEGTVSLNRFGLAGEIVGQTSPRASVTVRVLKSETDVLTYTASADATGVFRMQTERLLPGTPLTVTSNSSGTYVYRKPFVVPTPNPEANTITVVSDSAEAGVVFKTVPNGKIDLYVIEYAHRYYDTIQADANGIARVTDTVDPIAKGVEIQYAPAGTEGAEKKLVVYERAEPVFSLAGTPNEGDTTLTISSTAKLTTFTHYINGKHVGNGKTVSLTTPLKDGDVIKVVAKAGDREKTLEHRVAAVGPTILQVTDVAMTATHTVVSVRRDTRAVLQFFINGKLTTATPVSSTRFTVPAKPGDIVLVRLTRGGQKLDTRLALPQVTFSNIRLHDEQKTWVGMVLPNSRVTLQNGTKQITSGKSSSTGRVVMSLAPQPLKAKITLVSTRGVYRFVQTVNVKAGLTPVMKVAAPTSTMRTLTVNSNVDYGTITVRRGTTLIATKTVTSKSTPVAIAAQKSGTRLTIKFTTPKGRTQTVYVTVR
ncbi:MULTISPECIES: hypothetical protein [unclassified Exiguobacterium]|uniref:hypothetical protein n=1 Tax=unclassified Exiguobacterium TaxID=2644629 RepID=UPI00103ECAA4|nr:MULTISPECIES: hypothetical protein [unclassified Exiguobacterium]TCI39147.1 hypothetical protein EVJ29_00470 [Exiguobacterium sp. SH4S7]TCI63063.1 hypothetical protein EVJ21_05990 [Exiguobacterium sp. SH0S2]